ncbi:MAG: PilZ domain-containing protein [Planctomycetota bacterium]
MRWRRCLEQIAQRGGAVELAVARDYRDEEMGRHLLWRVRVLEMKHDELLVEQPMALGQLIPIHLGSELVVIISVGQNRWMFTSANIGPMQESSGPNRGVHAMRLSLPEQVERCQRRNYYRMETTTISLPEVDLWPLLDPKSVVVAERANAMQLSREQGQEPDLEATSMTFEDTMPEVGPKFSGLLLNLGGGGVGLRVAPEESRNLSRHKLFWLRFTLPPELETPVCATGKLIHTHMESSQHTYAGLAFDFSFNPAHQRVVVDQICRFTARQQGGEGVVRRSA